MDIGIKRGRVKWPDPQRVVLDEAVPARDLWKAPQTHDGTRRFGDGRPWKRPYLLSGLIPAGSALRAVRRISSTGDPGLQGPESFHFGRAYS